MSAYCHTWVLRSGWFGDSSLRFERFDPATPRHVDLHLFEFLSNGVLLYKRHGNSPSVAGELFVSEGRWAVSGGQIGFVLKGGHRGVDGFVYDVSYRVVSVDDILSLSLSSTRVASKMRL